MKKYMLVCVYEREIEHPVFFDTHEEAHEAMCRDFASVMGLTYEEVKDAYNTFLNGGEFYECAGMNNESAWCENYGNNCDWKIFDV